MASIINASSTGAGGIIQTADASGTLELQASSGLVNMNNVTGAMANPVGTTAQRPSSPVNGMQRYNTTTSALECYINGGWVTVQENSYTVEYVVVAGGGGVGTRRHGGGGGGGGYRSSVIGESSGGGGSAEFLLSLIPLTPYTVTIGAGGAGAPNAGGSNSNTGASNGGNSVFGSITSIGGGY